VGESPVSRADTAIAVAGRSVGTARTGRPRLRRFGVVFVLDLWERFSFFGMAAVLVLYLVASPAEGGLGMATTDAAAVFGAYMSLAFLAGLPGGWLADRILGPRRSAVIGGVLVAAGHLILAGPVAATTYLGLLCVACGTGLVKPATAALVAVTGRGLSTTETAFSVFYVSIQASALVAPIVVGALAEGVSWHAGFVAAGAGMAIGLVVFAVGMRGAGDFARQPANPLPVEARRRLGRLAVGAAAGLIAVVALIATAGGLSPHAVLVLLGVLTVVTPAAYVVALRRRAGLSRGDRRRTTGLVVLLAASSGFWMIFAQDASVLGVFARDNTDRTIGALDVPASWFQSLHPLFVLLMAPLFAWLWSRRDGPPRSFAFAAALLAGGGSFVVMAGAARAAADGPVSPLWLVGTYAMQAAGEMVIGPVGLALAARLAPSGRTGQYLGLYGLFAALGVVLGNRLYGLTAVLPLPWYFLLCGGSVVLIAAALFATSSTVDRLIRDDE
jgi:proton-dependent oligopeptide transporter, POT family